MHALLQSQANVLHAGAGTWADWAINQALIGGSVKRQASLSSGRAGGRHAACIIFVAHVQRRLMEMGGGGESVHAWWWGLEGLVGEGWRRE